MLFILYTLTKYVDSRYKYIFDNYIGIFNLNFIIRGDEVYMELVDKTKLSETSESIIIQLKPFFDINWAKQSW